MSDVRFTIPEGTPQRSCRSCTKPIYWIETASGKRMPVDPDGTSHFATCLLVEVRHLGARAGDLVLAWPERGQAPKAEGDARPIDRFVHARCDTRIIAYYAPSPVLVLVSHAIGRFYSGAVEWEQRSGSFDLYVVDFAFRDEAQAEEQFDLVLQQGISQAFGVFDPGGELGRLFIRQPWTLAGDVYGRFAAVIRLPQVAGS